MNKNYLPGLIYQKSKEYNFKSKSRANESNLLRRGVFKELDRLGFSPIIAPAEASKKHSVNFEGNKNAKSSSSDELVIDSYENSNIKVSERIENDSRIVSLLDDLFKGKVSSAEVCRSEDVSHDTLLSWGRTYCKDKLRNYDGVKNLNEFIRESVLSFGGSDLEIFLKSYLRVNFTETVVLKEVNEIYTKSFRSSPQNILCLYRMNDLRRINKHFEYLNERVNEGDLVIGCLETFTLRKERLWLNKIPVLSHLYFLIEFLFNRILPKINGLNKFYFQMTKGKGRLMSKAEGLGRLACCGFKIMDHKTINGLTYFVVQKEKEPKYDLNPSYGPLYAMPRLGKNGEIIKVFKMRTMHPYSEYLQDYLVNSYGYASSGKPANDFRIPVWGKFIRRYWIDELPQLINVFRGEMKLVGVRPVSQRYFKDIPREMQKLRLTQKPGCIPPYVALNRDSNMLSVLRAEKDYLEEKIKNPYFTDFKFFYQAVYNIVFNNKRSA